MTPSRVLTAFLVGLLAGLAGETLLFLEGQCARVESALRDDFRVVCFLKADPEPGREKVLEEQLRAIEGVEDVRYVSRQEALAELRRREPELVESALLLSDNPLLPAFEVKLDELGLARLPQWLEDARGVADWADLRYKSAQVQAALQAQFYRHAIDVSLSAAVCAAALLLLVGVWWPGGKAGHKDRAGATALVSAAGACAGAATTALVALPLRLLTPWWSWPPASKQALLVFGAGAVGWVLCRRAD